MVESFIVATLPGMLQVEIGKLPQNDVVLVNCWSIMKLLNLDCSKAVKGIIYQTVVELTVYM